MICADTSFLLSLTGNDSNSPTAVAHAQTLTAPVIITLLNRLEFENAIRLLRFRGIMPAVEAASLSAALAADEAGGRIVEMPCEWTAVFRRAQGLSEKRAEQEGHRLLDLLHVAAALELGATDFLTFDQRQRALALTEGLRVGP